MFSKVVNRASKGVSLSAQACRAPVVARGLLFCLSHYDQLSILQLLLQQLLHIFRYECVLVFLMFQQRNFGKFSDFSKAFKEEYAKAKAEAATKAGTAATEETTATKEESTTTTDETIQNVEETTQTETNSKVNEASEKIKSKVDESKQKMKESYDESKQKMKESMDSASKEAKEQLNKQKEKLSSFWGEFSGEVYICYFSYYIDEETI